MKKAIHIVENTDIEARCYKSSLGIKELWLCGFCSRKITVLDFPELE